MKKIKSVLLLLVGATVSITCPVYSSDHVEIELTNHYSVEPLADIIDWVFKVENGKLYKRKYK